jgi:hypothetical protein
MSNAVLFSPEADTGRASGSLMVNPSNPAYAVEGCPHSANSIS